MIPGVCPGDSICTEAPISVDELRSDTPLPAGWYENVMVPTSPNDANGAIVTLQSTCATHDGTSTFFFDDVNLMLDTVFKNDFEVHAHEGGPGGG